MRIAFDTRMRCFAGIGRFIDDLGAALSRSDLDVIALTGGSSTTRRPGSVAPSLPGRNVSGHPLGPGAQVHEARALRELRPDVLHSPHLVVPFLSRVPTLLTVHDLFPLTDPSITRSGAATAYYRAVFPSSVGRATKVVAISDFTADSIATITKVRREDITVIRHAVDRDRWYPRPDDAVTRVLEQYRLSPGYVLYVASAKSNKNLKTLFKAHTEDHLPLVVTGCEEEEALQVAGGSVGSNVRLLGRTSEESLACLYTAARAHVLPSLYEAVGLTVLEAWACGTAVICSNGGGLPENTGDAALVCPPLDVGAWNDALHVVEDPTAAAALAAAGLRRLGTRTWDDVAREYALAYQELVT